MAHFLCHLGCSHFGALLLDFYFTENNLKLYISGRDLLRVLNRCTESSKKGGRFLIVNESDGTNKADDKWLKIIDNMKIYTVEQLEFFLTEAGFSEITIDHKNKKHHICILAKK